MPKILSGSEKFQERKRQTRRVATDMIKGVNRQVVEVNDTGCEYFERIMFFVKPEYASISEGKIRERASMIANGGTLPPPTKKTRGKLRSFLTLAAAAAIGAVVTAIFINLF